MIVGAGVFGLAVATSLTRRGARPVVIDPAPDQNASSVAAGMISPALEAALEGADKQRADLYRLAAEVWPAFSDSAGIELRATGAEWRGPADEMSEKLGMLGFEHRRSPAGVEIPGEALVDAPDALKRMRKLVLEHGGAILEGRAKAVDRRREGFVVRVDEQSLAADVVVLAAGWACADIPTPLAALLPSVLSPIRGQLQLLRGSGASAVRRIIRGPAAYVAPVSGGAVVGATMEPGRTDLDADPGTALRLLEAAIALAPELGEPELADARVGIRGASPDGLPLVGATATDGLFTALAPRRNGWLLGAWAGTLVAAKIAGADVPAGEEMVRPDRFGPA